jgi:hypothetical protein
MRQHKYSSREAAVRRKIASQKRELRLLRAIERALAKFRRESEHARQLAKSQNGGDA